jgi:Mg2+/citrate symporter
MFTIELITEIVTLGVVALAVTQAIKKWVNVDGKIALIISIVVSALLALWRTLSLQPYDWIKFIILAIGIFIESNGTYKFGSYAVGKMVKKAG